MEHSKKVSLNSLTDDESITTSTESDSVETWTLVNDKNKKKATDYSLQTRVERNNRIDILTNLNDSKAPKNQEIHGNNDNRSDDDSNVDDISEGISIISESESAGRASPLAIEANLTSEIFNDYSNLENISSNPKLRLPIHIPQSSYLLPSTVNTSEENALRQRRTRHSSSSEISETKALNPKIDNSIVESSVHPLVRHSLKGAFFICVCLAILAFIGKLRNPDWQPWLVGKNLSALEEKLTNLELKNNLMRAEIDILSKQVNYLTNLWEKGKNTRDNFEKVQRAQNRHYKQTDELPVPQKSKSFKAWSGNGNNLDPVQITKDDLKKTYKCPDGKFQEIAGMCVENTESNIENIEDIFNKVDDVVVEQILEGINLLKKDSTDDTVHFNEPESSKVNPNDNYMYKESQKSNGRKQYIFENKYDATKHWKQHQHLYSEEDEDIYASGEGSGRKKIYSKQRNSKRYKGRSDENIPKDHFHKERHYDKAFAERLPKSGEWHGKLMKQREAARNENEFRQRKKNWYIERGNEREKMRHS
uniref:Centromere protein F n=1 Tax=Zeugodacus cucurbitae TaxID=28588 RepID=A0A0A1WJS9_ZEUCU